MIIKILGVGCSKCKVAEKQVRRAVEMTGRTDIQVLKIESIQEISRYNIMMTPAVIIDEKVIISGRIPSIKEILLALEKQ
mgnify:CR=1 FL=1